MKRKAVKAIVLGITIALMSGVPVMASESFKKPVVLPHHITISIDLQNLEKPTIEPRMFGKKKTVKKNYKSVTQIPAVIYYEEYINGAWYGGDLSWTGYSRLIPGSKLYEATFKGTLNKL